MENTSDRISRYKKRIHSELVAHDLKKQERTVTSTLISKLEMNVEDHKKVREVYQKAAVYTQEFLEKHISSIVTNALQSVYHEKNIEFKVVFDKKRNSTECKLSIMEDGEEFDLLEDRGFGIADVASFALRVAYILLDKVDNVMACDEPFRNLDSERIQFASRMIVELSKRIGMQFIISTHITDLTEAADNVIWLKLVNKRTVKV